MKKFFITILFFSTMVTASASEQDVIISYECRNLSLIAYENGESYITYNGEKFEAEYRRKGLTRVWAFKENTDSQIYISPNILGIETASYIEFNGQEKAEPSAIFVCERK